MESETVQDFEFKLPPTHKFVYRNKKYPFNFDLFKYFSKTLFNKQKEIQSMSEINLLSKEDESNLDFSDDTINNFICFCQKEKYQINNENAIHLNYLSERYNIEQLKKVTDRYISKHQNELRLQILSFSQVSSFNSETIEEKIAENLIEYIDEERLLSLPIPILYNIFSKYYTNQNHQNDEEENKIIDFLFKYLEINGRKASSLFSWIDFTKLTSENQMKLLEKSPTDFDFHFINSSYMKSSYEISNELLQKTQMTDNLREQMDQNYQSVLQEQKEMKGEIAQLKEQMIGMKAAIEKIYPIGSIYMSVNETSPQNLFGGTWEPWGQGRVPVGVSANGTFSSVEKTGGSEIHTLTENEIPSHGGHIPNSQANWGSCDEDTYYINFNGIQKEFLKYTARPFVMRAGNELTLRSFPSGGSRAHNNLQPYITCYMWKRTA